MRRFRFISERAYMLALVGFLIAPSITNRLALWAFTEPTDTVAYVLVAAEVVVIFFAVSAFFFGLLTFSAVTLALTFGASLGIGAYLERGSFPVLLGLVGPVCSLIGVSITMFSETRRRRSHLGTG